MRFQLTQESPGTVAKAKRISRFARMARFCPAISSGVVPIFPGIPPKVTILGESRPSRKGANRGQEKKESQKGRHPQVAIGQAAGLRSFGVELDGRTLAEVHFRPRKTSQPLGHRPGDRRPGLGGPAAARTGGTGTAGLERVARLRRRLRDPGQPGRFPRPGPATPGGRRGRRPTGNRLEDLRDRRPAASGSINARAPTCELGWGWPNVCGSRASGPRRSTIMRKCCG